MSKEVTGSAPGTMGAVTREHRNEWLSFLSLAFVGLPVVMVGSIIVYGFVVWFLQIMFFGPPS